MKVAVCYTKANIVGSRICDSFAESVEAYGDKVVRIYNLGELAKLTNCDVSFQVCGYNTKDNLKPSLHVRFRGGLFYRTKKLRHS